MTQIASDVVVVVVTGAVVWRNGWLVVRIGDYMLG